MRVQAASPDRQAQPRGRRVRIPEGTRFVSLTVAARPGNAFITRTRLTLCRTQGERPRPNWSPAAGAENSTPSRTSTGSIRPGCTIWPTGWWDNAADADDLLQEIFLTAYRKLDTFRGASALGTWLYRLAMNVCLDRLRSKAARQDQATDMLDDRMRPHRPETRLSVNRLDLERAIKALPEGSRAAFLLHDVEGFDHHEVGRILGIAEGTSKSQVHKARLRIREFLRRAGA